MQKKNDTTPKEQQQIMVMPYTPCNSAEEDEIDLRELFGVIKKRKKIIIAVTVIFVLLAFIYVILAKPIYEARATIQIGKELKKDNNGLLTSQYFDNIKNLKQYLDIKYDTSGKYRDKNTTGYIKSITIAKRNASKAFLSITAYAHSNNEAVKSIQKPIDYILRQDKAYYDTIIENKKRTLKRLNQNFIYDKTIILPQLKQDLGFLKTINLKKIDVKIKLVKSIDLKKIDNKIKLMKSINLKKIDVKIKLVKSIDLKKIDNKIKLMKSINIRALMNKIKQSEVEISKKTTAIESMRKEILHVVEKDPALATMTYMQIANLENDIGHLKVKIIDLESKILIINNETIPNLEKQKTKIIEETIPNLEKQKTKILEETIPNLEKQKTKIIEETIPNLEAEKIKLLKTTIPTKEAEIDKMTSVTLPGIQMQIKETKMTMKKPYLVMTHIVNKIYTHDKPIKPKKKLIIVVALITGLILGVFLAFFLEFLSKEDLSVDTVNK